MRRSRRASRTRAARRPDAPVLRRPFLRFGGLATLGLGAAAGALLSACGTRQAGGMPDAAVFEAASGRRIRPGDLIARMAATPIVLLGERHDNPVHHRFRADLIGAWTDAARGRPTAVVFEHFDREHDAALRVAQRTGPSVAARATTAPEPLERLLEAARFDRTVWGWPLHRPLFEAAAAGGALWIAANFSRASARRPAADAEPVLTAIVQSARWTDAAQRSLEQSLREGHCNLLPERAIGRLVEIQRLRDAALAAPLYDAFERRMILLAGNGHVRRDYGVPLYLGSFERTALVVGFEEASAPDATRSPVTAAGDLAALLGTARADDARAAYDLVVVTNAPARAGDPCDAFRASVGGAARPDGAVSPAAPTRTPSR